MSELVALLTPTVVSAQHRLRYVELISIVSGRGVGKPGTEIIQRLPAALQLLHLNNPHPSMKNEMFESTD